MFSSSLNQAICFCLVSVHMLQGIKLNPPNEAFKCFILWAKHPTIYNSSSQFTILTILLTMYYNENISKSTWIYRLMDSRKFCHLCEDLSLRFEGQFLTIYYSIRYRLQICFLAKSVSRVNQRFLKYTLI